MKNLEDQDLKTFCKSGQLPDDVIILDIREPNEYAREHIANSKNIPLSQLSITNLEPFKDKIVLVHCRSGNRTKQAKEALSKLPFRELICLSGGLDQWKRCGLETIHNKKAPLELMRQVQIIVGLFLILGTVLSYVISPYFILVNLFFSAGLLFAGLTGWCGLAKCLMRLPYNNRPSSITGDNHV